MNDVLRMHALRKRTLKEATPKAIRALRLVIVLELLSQQFLCKRRHFRPHVKPYMPKSTSTTPRTITPPAMVLLAGLRPISRAQHLSHSARPSGRACVAPGSQQSAHIVMAAVLSLVALAPRFPAHARARPVPTWRSWYFRRASYRCGRAPLGAQPRPNQYAQAC